jgi:hypothetical protein
MYQNYSVIIPNGPLRRLRLFVMDKKWAKVIVSPTSVNKLAGDQIRQNYVKQSIPD